MKGSTIETTEIPLTIMVWNTRQGLRILIHLSIVFIFIFFLEPLQTFAQKNQTKLNTLQASSKVIVLPPEISSGNLYGDPFQSEISSGNSYGDPFRSALTEVANATLNRLKYTVVIPESIQDPKAIEWLNQLQPLTSRLARGVINDDAQIILSHLATLPEEYLILVQFMKVKNGPPGGYYYDHGLTIIAPMSSTLLQAVLISTRTGQVIWKNEVLKWELYPYVNSPKFAKSIQHLYSTLGNIGEYR